MDSNTWLKLVFDGPTLQLEKKLANLEVKKRHSIQRLDNEMRYLQEFYEEIKKSSGHCGSAVPTSDKEAFEIRKKYNIMPKMSFSRENYRKGLAAVEARKNYRKSFMISNARKNLEEHKKLL